MQVRAESRRRLVRFIVCLRGLLRRDYFSLATRNCVWYCSAGTIPFVLRSRQSASRSTQMNLGFDLSRIAIQANLSTGMIPGSPHDEHL